MVKFVRTKKNRILLFFLIITLPFLFGIAYMIGFNQKASAAITKDSTSFGTTTWTHTTGNNPNTVLVVGTYGNVNTVTYGTQTMTQAVKFTNTSPTTISTLWYLANPQAGSGIKITLQGSGTMHGAAVTFYNVDTTTPIGAKGTYFGVTSVQSSHQCNNSPAFNESISASLGTTNANQVLIDFMGVTIQSGSTTMAPGSGQTALVSQSPSSTIKYGLSTKTAPNGSASMAWAVACGQVTYGPALTAIVLNPAPVVPTAVPTPVPTAVPTVVPTIPPPTSGNIINLNFGISNSTPWIQAVCGDIRMDGGVNNPAPAGQSMITINPTCLDPGIVYTGETNAFFGQGQSSSSNQIVGGSAYPELYSPPGMGGLFSSFDSMFGKTQMSGTLPTDLATICTLSNCTLPPNLPHGAYIAHSSVTLNPYTFPVGQNYVFLIDGNLTINGNVITPSSSSVLFSTSGNIIVAATVGSAPNVTTANLSGIFSTDKSFIMQSNNNCTDLRLNVEGSIVVNAALQGGNLQNNRDLCGSNAISPTLSITQRLDYVLNMPDFVKDQAITSQEIAP